MTVFDKFLNLFSWKQSSRNDPYFWVKRIDAFDDRIELYDKNNACRKIITYDKIKKYWIRTTEQGPFVEDVFFEFEFEFDGEPILSIPQGFYNTDSFITKINDNLEGFKTDTFIESMGSTSNSIFICYEK